MNIFAYIKKNPEKVAVILLALFFLINVCIFYNTFGSLLYDHGREFLVPSAILDGHALYKDILNIYGPLGYYFNALLFGIFGKSFSVLYYSGVVFSAIFLISFYKIVKETIDYIWATILSFFVIASCMFTPSLVSYVTPYSYSLLYALATYSVAIYMIIKFYKTEKIQYAYLTSLIAGICLSCKFEYFLLPLLMLIVFVFIKRIKPVDFIKCFMLLCVFPFISLLLMLWQGLSFNDIYLALKFIKNAAGSDSMIWFHRYIGIYPNIYWLPINLINFLIFVIELSALWLIYAILGRYNRYISIIFTLLLSFLLFFHHVCFTRYALFPIIILLLFLFNFRKLYKQYTLCFIIVIIGLISSVKTFWNTSIIVGYGSYTLPYIMFAFIYLMYTLFPEKFKKIHTYIILILFSLALVNSYQAIHFRFKYCRTIIYGPNNEKIYSTQEKALPLIEFLDWSDNNTNHEDNILVYPEGPIVNILAKRKTNLMLYSLHSIFMDTFGPKNVIKAIGENNIEYIVYVTGKSVFPFANNNYYPEFEEYLNKNYRAIIKFPKSNVPAADSYTVYKLIK